MNKASPSMAFELSTLRRIIAARTADKNPLPSLVLITHLLPTSVGYIQLLGSLFDLEIIAIPYSAQTDVVHQLLSLGYSVSVPSDLLAVGAAAFQRIELCARKGRSVVVQEIGGYLAEYVTRLESVPGFLGIVEDTNNGHWRYSAIDPVRLNFPVLSIAHSPIKAIEDRQVGDAVTFSVERILRKYQYRVLRGTNVLVFGFGSIGSSCARALRDRGARVMVWDVDPIKRLAASIEGFLEGSIDQLVPHAEIIVGATGKCSIGKSVIEEAKNHALLVSASSRLVEIDTECLAQFEKHCLGSDLSLYVGPARTIHVATNCYPVNFSDDSILGNVLDAIYSELYLCILEIINGKAERGLHDSPAHIHKLVAEMWCHSREIWPIGQTASESHFVPRDQYGLIAG